MRIGNKNIFEHLRDFFLNDLGLKIISLVMAMMLWLYLSSELIKGMK